MIKVDHIKKIGFSWGFSIFMLLLFLLGNTFLNLYLIGIGSLGILFFILKTNKSIKKIKKNEFFLLVMWLLFLLVIGLSFLTTHSTPKTLDSLVFYGFSFLVFWFFIKIPKKFFSKLEFSQSIILVSAILLITSLVMSLFKQSALEIPGMNLIYSTYGHNHLGAVLILILPLSWQLYFEKKKKSGFYILLPLFFSMGLLMSFGRVVVFIGFLQLLYILPLVRKNSFSTKKIFKFLILIFSILLLVKTSLSLISSDKLGFVCRDDFWLKSRFCKSIVKESRPFYWEQSLLALKEYPILGYGAGSFSLISRKYAQLPYVTSSYAHNAFFKIFAEIGLLGGSIFLVLMWGMLFQAWQIIKKEDFKSNQEKSFSLEKAMFIGLISIYFDVLFDFDWSFLGIFSLTLLFLALIIKKDNNGDLKNFFKRNFSWLEKISIPAISIMLIVLSSLFIGLEVLTRTGNVIEAFKLFPYFSTHRDIFRKNIKIEDEKLYFKWKAIYKYALPELEQDFTDSDPWRLLSEDPLKSLIKANDYEVANERLLKIYDLLETAEENYQYDIGYSKKSKFFDYSVVVADFLMSQGRYDEAVIHYIWIYHTEPWVFLFHEIPFHKTTVDYEKMDVFLREFMQVDSNYWAEHYIILSDLYKNQLLYEIETKDLNSINYYFDYINNSFKWSYQESLLLEAKLQWLANDYINIGDFDQAEEVIKIFVKKLDYKQYWGASQLGNFYIYLALTPAITDSEKNELIDKAKQEYLTCKNIFGGNHDHCQYGLDFIEAGDYDSLEYGRISKTILRRGGLVE